MKTKFRGLTLTALLLSASNITFAQQGDLSAVGDLPGYGEEAYFADSANDASPQQVSSHPVQAVSYAGDGYASDGYAGDGYASDGYAGDAHSPQPFVAESTTSYAPIGVSDLQQVGHRVGNGQVMNRIRRSTCDGGCDSGCNSCSRGRIGSILSRIDSNTWGSVEFLMWFAQDRDMPALVTTADPTFFPVLPEQGAANPGNVVTIFGDDIQGELSGGYRSDFGRYLTDNFGVGGRYWILAENNDSIFAAGNGSDRSIGRPFFDVNRPSPPNPTTFGENAVLVAMNNGAVGFTGAVAAEDALEMEAIEVYTRTNFGCANNSKLEFIGGYSHFEIDNTLRMRSTSIQTIPATLQTTTFNDSFSTENRFNGGQLGFEMMMTRGRWMARSLTKVHLGNMNQSVQIAGNSTVTQGGTTTTNSGGALALGNQGTYERDTFAFVPEANFKLGYKLRQNIWLSAGYSFLYFDNVALTGDVVDRVIDGTTLTTGTFATRPAFNFDDSSLWVQGLDLGVTIDF